MTATTDFLPFATGSSANVESQSSWVGDAVVSNGFTSGIASSAKFNKALRQGTFVSAGLATWISQQISGNVPDDGNLANFVTSITTALGDYIATLGYATSSGVGSTYATLASFANSLTTSGYQKLSGGLILQWTTVSGTVSSGATYSFPIAFPNACLFCNGTYKDNTSAGNGISLLDVSYISATQFSTSWAGAYGSGGSGDSASIKVIAIGK